MKPKLIFLSGNLIDYRLKCGNFKDEIKRVGHRPSFEAINFLVLLIL